MLSYSDIVIILYLAPECCDIADAALERLWAVASVEMAIAARTVLS